MNLPKISVIALYGTASIVALAAFVTALRSDITTENPAGEAGLYSPLIALSLLCRLPFLLFAENFVLDAWLPRRARGTFVGVGSLASAYLWIADEAGIHPSNLKLLADLSFIWIAAAIVVSIFMAAVFLRDRSNQN